MSNNDELQLYSKNNKNNNSQKKKTRNKNNNQNEDEIKVELIMKNKNKTESTEDKTKNNELILPKIETNNTLKQTHENDINYFSQKKEISNNESSKEKENKNLIISNENNTNINNENDINQDNNMNNPEKYENEEKKLIEIFNKNKNSLLQICSEIEENLNNIYNTAEKNGENLTMNKTQNIKSPKSSYKLSKEQKEILRKINSYKNKIKFAQSELDAQLNLNKVDELENALKERKNYLENIKRENTALKNLKNFQQNDEKEVKDILLKKEEIYLVQEKINKIKDEAKIKKDYNHTLSEKIKSQKDEINKLEYKCDLINQNINYYKKKKIETIKTLDTLLMNDINNETQNLNLDDLKKSYEETKDTLLEKQINIKLKIEEQNKRINEIINDNNTISTKIEKIMLVIKNNMNKIINLENKLKRKEKENLLISNSINEKKRKNTLADRKPFHVGPINLKPKTKKVFDYQKYLKDLEKNKNKIKLYSSVETNPKTKTLREIEKLRTDIQKTIKKNELDEKIDKIMVKFKNGKMNGIKNIKININNNIINNNNEEDVLNNLFKKSDEINGSNRYNFYVTEGANLPVSLKQESINNNLNSK